MTWAAFIGLVFLVAGNVVAVRFVSRELSPFWGAGTRFLGASLLFFGWVLIQRRGQNRERSPDSPRPPFWPTGRALTGALLYGIFQFTLAFALAYQALREVPAGLASVIFAAGPVFTLLFAVLARLERFRWRGLLGALTAVAGIAVMAGERAGADIPLVYLLLAVGAAACFALAPIVVKLTPPVSPALMNAIAMLAGALLLLSLSRLYGEPAIIPRQPATWAAQLYLLFPGSVGLFGLLLYLLSRWPASTVAYQGVLSPPVTIALSWWLLGEQPSGGLFLGGALVLAGVYFGTVARG